MLKLISLPLIITGITVVVVVIVYDSLMRSSKESVMKIRARKQRLALEIQDMQDRLDSLTSQQWSTQGDLQKVEEE